MDNILDVKHLQKYYGTKDYITKAVDNVSFSVEKGEFLGIMGPSGSGKTTVLNCISSMDSVTSGHIFIEDKDITTLNLKQLAELRRDKLGFIFQDFNLLDTMTGYENIALALALYKTPSGEIPKMIDNIGKVLQITDILKKYPYEMSGGQKQLISAARAVIKNPLMVLADEPTGSLDSKSARLLLESFIRLNSKLQTTILMVTHDAFSASYCNRILFIKDGKIYNELVKGNSSRKDFFNEIVGVISSLGGEEVYD